MQSTEEMRTVLYDFIRPEMAANDIEETPTNIYYVLKGIVEAWKEKPGFSVGQIYWMIFVKTEMHKLKKHPLFRG